MMSWYGHTLRITVPFVRRNHLLEPTIIMASLVHDKLKWICVGDSSHISFVNLFRSCLTIDVLRFFHKLNLVMYNPASSYIALFHVSTVVYLIYNAPWTFTLIDIGNHSCDTACWLELRPSLSLFFAVRHLESNESTSGVVSWFHESRVGFGKTA